MHRLPAKRRRGARVDGNGGPANGRDDAAGVGRRVGEGGVAVHGADA